MQEIFGKIVWNNSIYDYLSALIYFIGLVILIHIFKNVFLYRLKKWSERTETQIDDILVKGIEKTVLPILYVSSLYIGLNTLNLSKEFIQWMDIIYYVVVTFYVVRVIISVLNFALYSYSSKQSTDEQHLKQLRGIKGLINLLVWLLAMVFILDNLGVKISAVVAGLGIGGIAIALAAQAVLGDLFSYFVIFFDRPFVVGDFIIVDDKLGVVEYVGIKTTRIKALSGEQLVFSNTDLTNSRLHNFKKMDRRRVLFKLGVVYQTSYDKLKLIPSLVREIIEAQDDVLFDRGHFSSYGDFSLDFEFVYYIIGSDYNKYMDIQQRINFEIFKIFEEQGIEFAYPTQTLFLNREDAKAA